MVYDERSAIWPNAAGCVVVHAGEEGVGGDRRQERVEAHRKQGKLRSGQREVNMRTDLRLVVCGDSTSGAELL